MTKQSAVFWINSESRESADELTIGRGVQYVHWVGHKCIMVKVRGKRNTHKVCTKTGGIFQSRGIIIFAKQREMHWNRENRGNRNLWWMTKKGHQKFWPMKSEKFSGKGKILKIVHRVWTFFENRGKSETGEKCIMASEGWTPLTVGA